MARLPTIEPYELPIERDLPESLVTWSVDPRRALLLVHDMQEYFVRPFPTQLRKELISNSSDLVYRCRQDGIPVAYTAQPGDMTTEERGLLAEFWGPGMRRDPVDQCIVDELTPVEGDRVFAKWRYSAFIRSNLLSFMRAGARDQIIICGVYAHIGVLLTAIEAFSHDIETFVVADAIADFSEVYHRLAIEYAAAQCAAVTTACRVLA